MPFVSRKIVYPFFVVVILVVFFAVLYLAFFSQPLAVDTSNSSVSIVGDAIVIKIPLENVSNHVVNDVSVVLKSDTKTLTLPIKGGGSAAFLSPGEKYDFLTSVPLGESYSYVATVVAPFSRPVAINVTLDPRTVNPVEAQVSLPAKLIAGKEYTYQVKLCNVSPSDLAEVFWGENAAQGDFKEKFYEHSVPINKDECTTVYSSLTPLHSGQITIGFTLRVGALKKEESKVLTVEPAVDSTADSNS